MMRDISRCYASYFNRRYARTGTLWEGRFRSCLVESASYVLGCYRYIELNPVRAGIVTSPEAYPWSSHRGNAGRLRDPLLSQHSEYAALTQAAYLRFFAAGDDRSFLKTVREATSGGYPLVSDAMRASLKGLGARTEPGKPGPRSETVLREPYAEITYLTPN
jgi:putative transposase